MTTAGDVFVVVVLNDRQVRLTLRTTDHDIEVDMAAESAQWLTWQLVQAAALPWPPPLRFVRRTS